MSSPVAGLRRIGGIIRGDGHRAGPQVQTGEIQTELSNSRVAVLRAVIHKGTQVLSALRKPIGCAVRGNQFLQAEQLPVLPAFRIKLINVDDDVGVGINPDRAGAGQPWPGAVGGQNRDDVCVRAHVRRRVVGERRQQAAVVISVHVGSKEIAHHLVPTQRNPSA